MVQTISTASHAHVGDAFAAVDSAAIRVRQERCAKVRNRNVVCLKCADACTSGCISLLDGQLVIDATKCVGCGTCATVCPTCALEARNPSDAQLLASCLGARLPYESKAAAVGSGGASSQVEGVLAQSSGIPAPQEASGSALQEGDVPAPQADELPMQASCAQVGATQVTLVCEPALRAYGALLDASRAVPIVCAGRVDESLLAALAARGVCRVSVLCGACEHCAQRHGRDTARLVAQTAQRVLAAWGAKVEVLVVDEPPRGILAAGATAETARAARDTFFAQPCACTPIREAGVLQNEQAGLGAFADPACGSAKAGNSDAADSCALPTDAVEQGSPVQSEGSPARSARREGHMNGIGHSMRVMRDGTLPHFVPDRRERLLDALASIGQPVQQKLECRLWGAVVIDGTKCTSCRMCATFCPTGAIRKFDVRPTSQEDGSLVSLGAHSGGMNDVNSVETVMGVDHFPADCVKCGSCRDICPAGAITLLDEVRTDWLANGGRHRYRMKERPVSLADNPHQILDTMRLGFNGDLFER